MIIPPVSTRWRADLVTGRQRPLAGQQHCVQHPVHRHPDHHGEPDPGLAELHRSVAHPLESEPEQAGEDQRRRVHAPTVLGEEPEDRAATGGIERARLPLDERMGERRCERHDCRRDVQDEHDVVAGGTDLSEHGHNVRRGGDADGHART